MITAIFETIWAIAIIAVILIGLWATFTPHIFAIYEIISPVRRKSSP